ncbi:MAG: TerB family tellurite resistance protein [Deltaproteobacteria bacterium]|nr:TerB family tellurite resistance protein [Deltaproteobacteria bacterium]MBW2444388.1 TerB family tellurite resistance protein [Deltaproteobacteria bacterium]
MSLLDFDNLLRFIRGGEPSPEERRGLFREAVLMALARATSADTHIDNIEVETVQTILRDVLGEEISVADIRTAAKSELFEKEPLEKYLSGVARKLDPGDRITILRCLGDVIRCDERISEYETDYFDTVARALEATPSEIAGLARSGS